MFDELPVAAIFHARGERTPDFGMLPLEQPNDEDAGALGFPIELGFCVGGGDDGDYGEQATSAMHGGVLERGGR